MATNPTNPVVVALDGMSKAAALEAAASLAEKRPVFKVNDLLDDAGAGPGVLGLLAEHGDPFADAKLNDIPKTMGNRTRKLVAAGAKFITIHGSNTVAAMKAAVDNRDEATILVVTVLTSMNEDDCNDVYGAPVKAKVLHFARNAVLAGAQGIVCSPKELEFLSKYSELAGLIRVTPGIRPDWHQKADDQKRVMTPAKAIRLGATYLVMGRPILKADIPMAEAMSRTLKEISTARESENPPRYPHHFG